MSKPLVHSSAVIDHDVQIGDGARVWHFCHISEGARIGARATLGQNVFVGRGVRIGDGTKVQNNVSIYEGVEIAEDVFLGPSSVFTNVMTPRAFIDRRTEFRSTRVGRGATIGANATIVCGTTIGAFSFIGAGAAVSTDVPEYGLFVGNPARRIGWVCKCGVRLPDGSHPTCGACGETYTLEGDVIEPNAETSASEGPIPFVDLRAEHAPLLPNLKSAFERVVQSGEFILGQETRLFEQEAARALGVTHAVGVSSGTDALIAALLALGIGPGDEVITTAYSFFATAGSIARAGATPVFVDIDLDTFNIDPRRIEAAITKRSRAIIVVHLFGRACDMRAIRPIADKHDLSIIEDAAQAFGASSPDGPIGALGEIGCFSFFPTKNLGALGDAGLVVAESEQLTERIQRLRTHGAKAKHHHFELGSNFRLDALQAAFLREKLPFLPRWNAARRKNAEAYSELFAKASLDPADLIFPATIARGDIVHQYVIRSPHRDALRTHLAHQGIATEIYYPRPLPYQPVFASLGHGPGSFPIAERACRETLSLPVFPELGEARVARIAREVLTFFRSS